MANIDINGYTPYFQDFGSISQKEYHQMVKRLQESPDDIVAIGDVAIFLLGYIFSETISNYTEEHSEEDVLVNKLQAAPIILDVIQPLKDHPYLRMVYLAMCAEIYFFIGKWNTALKYYDEVLHFPEVLDSEYDSSHYLGQLELAAKVIHNECSMYVLAGENDKARSLMHQYDYIFQLEKQRTERLIRNNPNLADSFTDIYNTLSDYSAGYIYYPWKFADTFFPSGDLLKAINADCVASGKPTIVDLDKTLYCKRSGRGVKIFDSIPEESLIA